RRITETGTCYLAGALRHRSRSLWRLLDQSGQLRFRKNAARPDRAGHGDVPDHASRCDPRFFPKTSMDIVAGILGPGRDSNPRSAATRTTLFETAPFDRSGTSPHKRRQALITGLRTNETRNRHPIGVH